MVIRYSLPKLTTLTLYPSSEVYFLNLGNFYIFTLFLDPNLCIMYYAGNARE